MMSPSLNSRPMTRNTPAAPSIWSCPAPQTQGRPMPRATTAACEVIPPRAVTIARAACMPWISSGLVSTRTRITSSPRSAMYAALSESKTTLPTAAPGLAGRPLTTRSLSASSAMVGCRSWSSWPGSRRSTASFSVINPSAAMSTAIFRAAAAVRLPLRVWSM